MLEILYEDNHLIAINKKAGEIVHINWENKHILNTEIIKPRVIQIDDPNPRGGTRGGKGIAVIQDKIIVC